MTLTIIPRTDWQSPKQPVTGPAMEAGKVHLLVAHYTAASTIPADVPAYLRAIQNDYLTDPNRGYSIGYNFAIDQAGLCYQLRGLDIKCAANKGNTPAVNRNPETIAVLCLVNGAEAMNAAMLDTFHQLAPWVDQHFGRTLDIVGHRDIDATACPGDGIYGQLSAGVLDPPAEKPNPPEVVDPPVAPPPTPESPQEYDVIPFLIHNRDDGQIAIVYADGKVCGLDGPSVAAFEQRFGPKLSLGGPEFAGFASKGG